MSESETFRVVTIVAVVPESNAAAALGKASEILALATPDSVCKSNGGFDRPKAFVSSDRLQNAIAAEYNEQGKLAAAAHAVKG